MTPYERTKAWRAANPDKVREHRTTAYIRNKAKERGQQQLYDQTPKGKYVSHKKNARVKGIPFLLSFEEWWTLWHKHWEDRGQGKLVMCREGDSGAYEVGNVRIDSQSNNAKEYYMDKGED